MSTFRLTVEAVEHVESIFEFTVDRFGEYQAEAYVARLKHTFELIADAAFELASELRRFRYQAHYIFYTPASDCVVIKAVLHTKRDIRRAIFE